MKISLTKTILYTLFYFGIFYVFTFIAFVLEEVLSMFHPKDNLDKVNQMLTVILFLMSWVLSVTFLCLSLFFPVEYIKSLKERGNY